MNVNQYAVQIILLILVYLTENIHQDLSIYQLKITDLNLLARIIHGEARGEPYNGMVGVAAVVLNRVANPNFPSTVAGVIYQKGAFDAVSDGQINLTPSTQAYNAARDALNGWDPTGGAIYYFNPATATNKWIWSRPHTITIGRHRFCK